MVSDAAIVSCIPPRSASSQYLSCSARKSRVVAANLRYHQVRQVQVPAARLNPVVAAAPAGGCNLYGTPPGSGSRIRPGAPPTTVLPTSFSSCIWRSAESQRGFWGSAPFSPQHTNRDQAPFPLSRCRPPAPPSGSRCSSSTARFRRIATGNSPGDRVSASSASGLRRSSSLKLKLKQRGPRLLSHGMRRQTRTGSREWRFQLPAGHLRAHALTPS